MEGRKCSKHSIYANVVSDIRLRTTQIIKEAIHPSHFMGYSDSERGNLLLSHGLLFPISSMESFMCIISCVFELFLVPASVPQHVQQRLWYVLSSLWDDAYKRTLANWKE